MSSIYYIFTVRVAGDDIESTKKAADNIRSWLTVHKNPIVFYTDGLDEEAKQFEVITTDPILHN